MVASSKALVDLANENGMALEIKDFDWSTWNAAAVSQEQGDRLMNPLAAFLKTKTRAELFEEAVKRSILLAPILNIGDLVESPQLKEREFWVQVNHPELESNLTYPGFPMKLSGLTYRPQRRAPLIGEHNEEIYMGELGRSKSELILLKAQRVI
jgi:crotonobetainyl-CoA:carnitine CoA-transferase CaiB-like acyl-CoA transferase